MECVSAVQKVLPSTTQDWSGSFRGTFDAECLSSLAGATLQARTILQLAARIQALALEAEAQNQYVASYNAALMQGHVGAYPAAG